MKNKILLTHTGVFPNKYLFNALNETVMPVQRMYDNIRVRRMFCTVELNEDYQNGKAKWKKGDRPTLPNLLSNLLVKEGKARLIEEKVIGMPHQLGILTRDEITPGMLIIRTSQRMPYKDTKGQFVTGEITATEKFVVTVTDELEWDCEAITGRYFMLTVEEAKEPKSESYTYLK